MSGSVVEVMEQVPIEADQMSRRRPSCYEAFIYTLSLLLSIFFFFVCMPIRTRKVRHFERAVILRFGRVKCQKKGTLITGPGTYYLMPFIDEIFLEDTRMQVHDVSCGSMLTKDGITLKLDVTLRLRVAQPSVILLKVERYRDALTFLVRTSMADIVGEYTLEQILSSREPLNAKLMTQLSLAGQWGLRIEGAEIQDVSVDHEVRKIFGAETLAHLSNRAKQIDAKTEHETTMMLQDAAKALQSCPAALQLRYLQSLSKVSGNSTVMFPLPLEMLSLFKKGA